MFQDKHFLDGPVMGFSVLNTIAAHIHDLMLRCNPNICTALNPEGIDT